MSAEIEDAHLVICAERKSMPIDIEVFFFFFFFFFITIINQEGKTYYWCSCGRSAKQPFCDGEHCSFIIL